MPQVHENIASNHDLSFGRWLRRVPPHAGAGLVPLQSQPSLPSAGAGLVPALNNVLTSFKNMSNIVCGPAQDRPLRSAERLESNFQVAELGKRYTMENSHGQSLAPKEL